MASDWIRARFKANADDYRPVAFPPPGPYWCTGFGDNHSIVVAYVKSEEQIAEFWPEAEDIDVHEENTELVFTDRFPRPEWWK